MCAEGVIPLALVQGIQGLVGEVADNLLAEMSTPSSYFKLNHRDDPELVIRDGDVA